MANEKLRLNGDHLLPNPHRVLGPQTSGLTHCAKHAQFYPKTEDCPWCLSAAEERALKARADLPPARKTPGQRAYEKRWTNGSWLLETSECRDQWEQIAAMATDVQPEAPEDDYDTWANMMAMKIWADPYLALGVRNLKPRRVIEIIRNGAPHYARLLGLFDRDPPAGP